MNFYFEQNLKVIDFQKLYFLKQIIKIYHILPLPYLKKYIFINTSLNPNFCFQRFINFFINCEKKIILF